MRGHNRRDVLAGFGASLLAGCRADSAPLWSKLIPTDDLIWGVNGHPFRAYPDISFETQIRLVRELGMTHYRIGWDFDQLATLKPIADRYGVTLLPIIHPDGPLDDKTPQQLYDDSFERARWLTRRYRGQFPVWELGNELESHAIIQPCEMRDDGTQYPCEWGPAGGVEPEDYYGPRWDQVSFALRGLLDGAKAGDPHARRAIGTAGWGHLGAFERWKSDGLDWEITVWHDYETVRESYLEVLASFGKPIWITEFNAGGGGFETEEDNARMLTERIAFYRSMREKYRVEAAFIYELLDEPYWDDFEGKMGLYRLHKNDKDRWYVGDLKPAGEAVKAALSKS
ncbi:hypothetical protein WNY37_13275 [Henriciella sp. AS95]|uniref:hypothetical protein n=1 Tax=Henriciella sp. AS95 TaxID=3135782 RepID=UPI003175520D